MTADTPTQPVLPRTPPEAVANTHREHVIIEDRTFLIDRPTNSDRLLDDPVVRSAWVDDDYMPYWADLWPAARMLAKWIMKQRWPAGLHALEIGCGLGLPGIAALAMGLKVTFSDYDATAVDFAADNALINGLTNFERLQMDWRYPPEGLQVPVILASDLIYEERNVAPLVALVKKVLAPGGRVPADGPGPHSLARAAAASGGGGTAVHDADAAGRRAGRAAVEGNAVPDHAGRRGGSASVARAPLDPPPCHALQRNRAPCLPHRRFSCDSSERPAFRYCS